MLNRRIANICIIVVHIIKYVDDSTILFLEIKGAANNLFRKPNSRSKINGKPEFKDPVNAVKIIIPQLKNCPYFLSTVNKLVGMF